MRDEPRTLAELVKHLSWLNEHQHELTVGYLRDELIDAVEYLKRIAYSVGV